MNITWPRAKCHLGAQCRFLTGELRPRYKCVICKVQLHSEAMGYSTPHGMDGAVRCNNMSACQRRSKPPRKHPHQRWGIRERVVVRKVTILLLQSRYRSKQLVEFAAVARTNIDIFNRWRRSKAITEGKSWRRSCSCCSHQDEYEHCFHRWRR